MRVECSTDIAVPDAVALADTVGVTLGRYASEPYKDPRAPQNLYPIGGLERELRRRLGDPRLMFRALRVAAGVPAREMPGSSAGPGKSIPFLRTGRARSPAPPVTPER